MANPLFETFVETIADRSVEETIRFEEAGMIIAQGQVQIQVGIKGLETAAMLALRWQLIHAVKAKQPLKICYQNHTGKVDIRHVMPTKFWHGTTKWHSKPGWFLKCLDLDRKDTPERDFYVTDMKGVWIDAPVGAAALPNFTENFNPPAPPVIDLNDIQAIRKLNHYDEHRAPEVLAALAPCAVDLDEVPDLTDYGND